MRSAARWTLFTFIFALLFAGATKAQTISEAQQKKDVQKSLEQIKFNLKKAKRIQDYYAIKDQLSSVKNKSTWIMDHPTDPLTLDFKTQGLKVFEVTEPNTYLNRCAQGNSQLANKVFGWNQSWIDDIQQSQKCSNPDTFKKGLSDIYKVSAALEKPYLKSHFTDPYDGITDPNRIQMIMSLQNAQVYGDIKVNNKIPDLGPAQAREQERQNKVKKIQRQNGFDPDEIGPEAENYINQKYGIYGSKDIKNKQLKAATLHQRLMQKNRENCLNNYMFYSQHFDFSDEPEFSKSEPQSDIRQNFKKLFCDKTCAGIDNQHETEQAALSAYKKLQTKYEKPRLTVDDVYDKLLPILQAFNHDTQAAQIDYNKARATEKSVGLDNDQARLSQQAEKNRQLSKSIQLSKAQEKALAAAKNTEVGFLLHTKKFKDQWHNLPQMTPAEVKKLLKHSLKSSIQDTKDYSAKFIKNNQSQMTQSTEDLAQSSQIFLFSSPLSLEKTVASDLSLFGSLCEPIKSAVKDRTIEVPEWIEFGGGLMNVVSFAPGIGTAANIAFQATAAAVQAQQDQDKKNAIKETTKYGYTGENISDVDFSDKNLQERINNQEVKKLTDHQKNLIETTAIGVTANVALTKALGSTSKNAITNKKDLLTKKANAASLQTGKISKTQADDLLESHLVGLGQPGAQPGTLATLGNYTYAQIREKYAILRKSYSAEDAKTLLQKGVAGADEAEVNAYLNNLDDTDYSKYDYKNYAKPRNAATIETSKIDFQLSNKASKAIDKFDKKLKNSYEDWVDKVNKQGLVEVRKIPGYHDEKLINHPAFPGCRSVRLDQGYRVVYREFKQADGKTMIEIVCAGKDCYKH